jgi:hypothetical protein
VTDPSEAELVDELRAGAPDALGALFERCGDNHGC